MPDGVNVRRQEGYDDIYEGESHEGNYPVALGVGQARRKEKKLTVLLNLAAHGKWFERYTIYI